MAFSQKQSEQGWFYHAPAKIVPKDEIVPPHASQIPGLCDLPPGAEDMPKKMVFYETDSKYVRMAKQGGRKDLLAFQDPKPKAKEPKGYPRVDWYYLEDNAQEEAEEINSSPQKTPYQPMLPEYMVHEEYNPNGLPPEDPYHHKRAPYHFDQQNAFQRGGPEPTDKLVKLPEVKHMGYGIRAEKLKNKCVKYDMPPREKGKPPQGEIDPEKKYRAMAGSPEERPVMSKILSFGYGKEWDEERKKWYTENKHLLNQPSAKDGKLESEYRSIISKNGGSKPGSRQRPKSDANSETAKLVAQQKIKQREEAEKELFKMSRFKNVPAKTQSYRTKSHQGTSPQHIRPVAS